MSRAVAAKTGRGAKAGGGSSIFHGARRAFNDYLKQSDRPLASLAFVFPLILIYEIGWRSLGSRLLAFNLLHQFFAMIGAPGTFIPALALVGILLAWHLACRDKWSVSVNTLLGMAIESLLLALPLLALAAALARWQTHPLLWASSTESADRIIIALGAGIYEELIFRLIALTLLNLILVDMLRLSKSWSSLLMVVISAVLFSLYHYLGPEKFAWKTCLFRTLAGIYFGVIFICRGFGVTAGCHAIYDVIAVALSPLG
jgi:membrane protease YdiL (CAAX protease family)